MLSAVYEEKSVPRVILFGINALSKIAGQDDGEQLATVVIESINKITEEIPARIVLLQDDKRFITEEQDSWYTTAVKSGKRFAQKMGKETWDQQIPLKNVISYHLLNTDGLYKKWIDEDEGILLRIILEIEQVLLNKEGGRTNDIVPSGLQQMLKVFINQIEEHSSIIEQESAADQRRLKKQVMRAVSKAGTLEQMPGIYRDQRLSKKKEVTYKRLCKYINDWQNVNKILLDKALSMQQFLVFGVELETETSRYKKEINAYFDRILLTPLNKLDEKLAVARQKIASQLPIPEVITAQQQQLSHYLEEELIEPLEGNLEREELRNIIEQLKEPMLAATSQLNEKTFIISRLNREVKPPKLKSHRVEWRALVERGVREEILTHVKPEKNHFSESLKNEFSEIKEMQKIIEMNLSSAAKLGGNPSSEDNPQEIADDALERTQNKLQKTRARITDVQESLYEPAERGRHTFTQKMMELLYRSDAKEISMLDTRYKVGEKKETLQENTRGWWIRTKDRAGILYRFITIKTKQFYARGNTVVGLKKKEVKEKHKADIAAWLLDTKRRIQELPFIYRQLFAINEVPERRNYISVNENFGTIRQAYERWQEGVPTACAIVGEKGSGKSTYLYLVQEELFKTSEDWHFDLNQTIWNQLELLNLFREKIEEEGIASIDDLITHLNSGDKKVIVFEGIHNLYLRHLNGYEAIEQLIYLVSETTENVFWVVSCSRYAWAFLDKAANIGNHFSPSIRIDTLDEKQIERLILSRHGASGYELVFEAEEAYKKSRTYRRLMNDEAKAQEHLREKYFEELAELAGGNALIAMIFWIRSIHAFDDSYCYITPLDTDSLDMVEDLTPETLFVLAAVILHDMLSSAELSTVLGISQKESKLIFNRLKAKGILVAQENGMALNQLMYRHVIRELKERNILHLE